MFIKTNTVKISKVLTEEEIESVDTNVKFGERPAPKLKALGELVSQNLKEKMEK